MWVQVVSWGKKSANSNLRLKSSMEVIRVHFSWAKGDQRWREASCWMRAPIEVVRDLARVRFRLAAMREIAVQGFGTADDRRDRDRHAFLLQSRSRRAE